MGADAWSQLTQAYGPPPGFSNWKDAQYVADLIAQETGAPTISDITGSLTGSGGGTTAPSTQPVQQRRKDPRYNDWGGLTYMGGPTTQYDDPWASAPPSGGPEANDNPQTDLPDANSKPKSEGPPAAWKPPGRTPVPSTGETSGRDPLAPNPRAVPRGTPAVQSQTGWGRTAAPSAQAQPTGLSTGLEKFQQSGIGATQPTQQRAPQAGINSMGNPSGNPPSASTTSGTGGLYNLTLPTDASQNMRLRMRYLAPPDRRSFRNGL